MQEMELDFEEFQGDVDSAENVEHTEDTTENGEEKEDEGTIEIKKRVLRPQPKLNELRYVEKAIQFTFVLWYPSVVAQPGKGVNKISRPTSRRRSLVRLLESGNRASLVLVLK